MDRIEKMKRQGKLCVPLCVNGNWVEIMTWTYMEFFRETIGWYVVAK